MTESPYEHLFVRDLVDCRDDMINEAEQVGRPLPKNLSRPWALMRSDDVPEAKVYLTMSWVHPIDEETFWVQEHEHDFDEMLVFTGSNPEDPRDLGAEVYMEIEGERHIITTSSSVYIPAGTKHCPLGFNRVDRPFRFLAIALSGDGHYLPASAR